MGPRHHHLASLVTLALAAASVGCAPREQAQGGEAAQSEQAGETVVGAVAVLHPTAGNEARGTVTFRQTESGIAITAQLEGLAAGDHGFHIHALGDCSAPDATSAGGHFNPAGSPHGSPTDEARHVGDLGNVTANATGAAHHERTDSRIGFAGPSSIIGRAVIVHAGADDLTTQPTGNAGGRVACGVIGIAALASGM